MFLNERMNVPGDEDFHPGLSMGPQIIKKANAESVQSASLGIIEYRL